MMQQSFVIQMFRYLERQSKGTVLVIAVALAMMMAAIDVLVGTDYSLALFYLIPISIMAWFFETLYALIFSIICAFAWFYANEVYTREHVLWVMLTNIGYYLSFSVIVSRIRVLYDHQLFSAKRDQLTGILNVTTFNEYVTNDIALMNRSKEWFSLIYLGMEGFKEVNRSQGYVAGDALLAAMVSAISAQLRKTDKFARLGGAEFVLFLPSTNISAANDAVSKIKNAIASANRGAEHTISYNIGVVSCLMPNMTLETLVARAKKLYAEARGKGQGGVVCGIVQ